ncbi:nitroreductase/quinone reductase family protein [Micromonospora sp. NPDC005806]|uniref:nitroreductase/quinone reductase family protein n=1 Tax=Micromonospora sp. NPDC005806 TaxID=3364234 RepID=UPI003691EBB6
MANAISDALQGVREVEITVTGRKSGRQITHPVWFVQEEDSVFLVPVTGSNSDWYKNVQRTPMIQLAANGTALSSSVTPITEADRVNHVVAMFRDKYGADQVEAFYPRRDVAVQVPLG